MAQESLIRNPFMLLMHPEVVLAAVEKSQHLGQLNRHLCRPLDRVPGAPSSLADRSDSAVEELDLEDDATAAQTDAESAQGVGEEPH